MGETLAVETGMLNACDGISEHWPLWLAPAALSDSSSSLASLPTHWLRGALRGRSKHPPKDAVDGVCIINLL